MAIPLPPPPPPPAPDRLPLRWALILFAAVVIGIIFGALTFLLSGIVAAVLAGLTASGATAVGLNSLLA